MGLIFLRHAYSRYLMVKPEIEVGLPSRGGMVPAWIISMMESASG